MMDMGSANDGMMVAERLRKKTNITITTRQMVSIRVNFTSLTDDRIETERSYKVLTVIAAGICCSSCGSTFLMLSTTSTVFVPGWRRIASTMARLPLYQLAVRLSWTLAVTVPSSFSRTGAPL